MTTKNEIRFDNDVRNSLYVELKRTGGDPSVLFDILYGIIQRRDWENLKDDRGQPIGSLKELIERPLPNGCGQSLERVRALLEVPHRYERKGNEYYQQMEIVRKEIREIHEDGLSALNKHGANQFTRGVDMSTPLKGKSKGGNSRDYTIERLERDAPEIAERVKNREISAKEGAEIAGFHKKVSIRMDNPLLAAESIIKYMKPDDLIELVQLLAEHLADSE